MKKIGKVLQLFISDKNTNKRIEKKFLNIDKRGVIFDKFYANDINRSILITNINSYELVQKQNINISFGELGENILIDYNIYSLDKNHKIQISDVILQISQNCTICNHLSKIDKKVPKILKNDRGIFVKVIKGGTVKKGDNVYIH